MMMKIEFHAPGDFLVVQGDLSTEMYFVGEGILGIREYENKPNLSSKDTLLPTSSTNRQTTVPLSLATVCYHVNPPVGETLQRGHC